MVCVALHTVNRYHFLNSLFFSNPALPTGGRKVQGGRRGETYEAVGTIGIVEYKGTQYPERGIEERINSNC